MKAILDAKVMSESTMGDLLNEMTNINAGIVSYVFRDNTSKPHAAVIVLRGEDTEQYIKALEDKQEALDKESEVQS